MNQGTIKVWDAGAGTPIHTTLQRHVETDHVCSAFALTDSLQLLEEREGDGSTFDATGSSAVAERKGTALHLKEGGGAFYAPSPLTCVAVHLPRLVAGAESGELYHLELGK